MLNDEAALVIERENNRLVTEALLNVAAIAAGQGSEEANKQFSDLIDDLRG